MTLETETRDAERELKIENLKSKIHPDGILVIDKPAGWTSHDVVARARRLLREKRVGHTGTLDPFATGVLVLLVGRATRLAQFLAGAEKEYEAVVRFGYKTETGDLTGAPLPPVQPSAGPGPADLMRLGESGYESALAALRGEIEQVPPMYSAKKVQGRKLYELARRGEEVERKPARVTIREFEIATDEPGDWLRRNADDTCDLRVRVVCSAGTYVRVLAEQLGEQLGVGAHLAELRRTRAGTFSAAAAITLNELQTKLDAGLEVVTTMSAALSEMPAAHLTAGEVREVRHGMAVRPSALLDRTVDGGYVRMLDAGGRVLAVGTYDAASGRLRPRVVFAGDEE